MHIVAAVGVIVALASLTLPPSSLLAAPQISSELRSKFEYLSTNGNSNCSRQFMQSIPRMPADARLQGSCCSPMDPHRYGEQIERLKAYSRISLVPADPYDIPAPIAARLMGYYDLPLSAAQQKVYDFAMQHSNERGPCCCKCWRWAVYGGLAKHLIREQRFTGPQIARLWDLSDGCGGTSHAH